MCNGILLKLHGSGNKYLSHEYRLYIHSKRYILNIFTTSVLGSADTETSITVNKETRKK